MPKYSNRMCLDAYIYKVIFDNAVVIITTSLGEYEVPENVLTRKIYESEHDMYALEFDPRTEILTGITSPEGSILYRIDDTEVKKIANTSKYLSRLVKDGQLIPKAEAIEKMMQYIFPHYIDRLKHLPQEYLNEFYIYETKISYLASYEGDNLLFDPTPSELSHALAISMVDSSDYPPLIQKTY